MMYIHGDIKIKLKFQESWKVKYFYKSEIYVHNLDLLFYVNDICQN